MRQGSKFGVASRSGQARVLLAVLSLLGATAVSASDLDQAPAGSCVENACGERCQEALDAARRFTARYQREQAALADDYVREDICVALPGVGAMGYHYPNFVLMGDTELDVRTPEILLYAAQPNGKRRLIGLEYFVPVFSNGAPWMGSETQPPPVVDNPPPVLFGQTFQGPMGPHAPGMPWHYDLHVWLWSPNPSGTFAMFNPALACPD